MTSGTSSKTESQDTKLGESAGWCDRQDECGFREGNRSKQDLMLRGGWGGSEDRVCILGGSLGTPEEPMGFLEAEHAHQKKHHHY